MDLSWKQSEVSGTVLESSLEQGVFFRARLKLTSLYILIVAIIVFGFSIFLYQSIGHNLRDARDDDFSGADSRQHFVENTLGSIEYEIFLADIFILVITAGLSFFFAGKTLKPIERSVEAQKVFAANASHELRTPLAVIRNDIEVFLRNTSRSKEIAVQTMQSNLEEVSRMSGIVEDLLLLARSDNQVLAPYKKVDLDDIVKSAVLSMQTLATRHGIKMSYTSIGVSTVYGVESGLKRVILNILQNSIDHSKSGGSIDVSLETEKRGSVAVLSITDTGSGIPARDLPHIFTRFYKGDSAKGVGLGLAIVKEIVSEHKGKINVKSEGGKGTSVIIRIPRA